MKCQMLCWCCGTMIAATAAFTPFALAADQSKPATDQAKDVAKDAMKKGQDAAKDAVKKGTDAAKEAMGGGEDPEMMKRWMDFATPGEHHKHLEQWAGEWNGKVVMYMAPGEPPIENKMTASTKVVMGGRYVIEKVQGTLDMGDGNPSPFEGMSTMGYDNHKKQYFSTWIDNMGTGIMEEWGTCDGSGKVLTSEGKTYDPMIGSERASKSIATVVDADTRKLEMFAPGPDGKMFKNMEITYTRKK